MALRNATDGLASETLLRRLFNNLNFARDNSDRLRAIIDNTVSIAHYRGGSSTVATADNRPYYDVNTGIQVDGRDPLRMQHRANAIAVRNGRWTFS